MHKEMLVAAGHPGAHARRPFLPVVEVMLRLWHAYWRWRCHEATVRVLQTMDERRLRDIGLDPDDLRSLTQGREVSSRKLFGSGKPLTLRYPT